MAKIQPKREDQTHEALKGLAIRVPKRDAVLEALKKPSKPEK